MKKIISLFIIIAASLARTVFAADGSPPCGTKAASLDPITLKELLPPAALRRGVPKTPRFCATEECPIVCFDARGSFTEDDLIVRVHAKHPHADDVFFWCCFAY